MPGKVENSNIKSKELENKGNSERERLYFTSFHELMTRRVAEILLVSSPYDAFIMQEDGRLSERIIHEYRGLNLTRPPRLTWVSNGQEAISELENKNYDIVIVMPHISDMDAYELCAAIKDRFEDLPIYYFAYDVRTLVENERWLKEKSKRFLGNKKQLTKKNAISEESTNLIADKTIEEKGQYGKSIIDRIFIWSGNTDLLMALVKNREDFMNVDRDTQLADVRVIIVVEDSPLYLSSILPYIYKEIVMQTQAVMDDSLNETGRILRMRARPKILVAENYEDALRLYQKYSQYLLCVISDVRYPRGGKDDPEAGITLLTQIRLDIPDIPLLMLSSEIENKEKAERIPAFFLDKRSASLHADIRYFFVHYLGFGDFMFRLKDGTVVARASNLRSMITILHSVPGESIAYHAMRNDFSRWFMARFEMQLASKIRPLKLSDFASTRHIKEYIRTQIRNKLRIRQKGLVSDFIKEEFDPESDFVKIGRGSLGGKARGLAFISNLFREQSDFQDKFPDIDITLPKTVVITTEGFDDFAKQNNTRDFLKTTKSDKEIIEHFKTSDFPDWLYHDLKAYLKSVTYPLAVRSSAILEDAHYRPSAGAYNTYMIPNNHPDVDIRLQQLVQAIKLVYASVYQEAPRIFAKNSVYRPEEDKMAVIIQQLSGTENGSYFYPAISGVAQSWNFYPVSYMKPEEGVAHIALGLGKIVVDGGVALRFSPKYPEFLPQFSSVENILKNAQRYFYALRLKTDRTNYIETTEHEYEVDCKPAAGCDNSQIDCEITDKVEQTGKSELKADDKSRTDKDSRTDYELKTDCVEKIDFELAKLDVDDAIDHLPVKKLLSSYIPEDNRIRDFFSPDGYPVLTFASILKLRTFPLGEILSELLEIGKKGMGCPVEVEFAVNLYDTRKPEFCLLQIRPMMVARHNIEVEITPKDIDNAFCYSDKSMGSSQITKIYHIIYVKPESFDTSKTVKIAEEINRLNSMFDIQEKDHRASTGEAQDSASSEKHESVQAGIKDKLKETEKSSQTEKSRRTDTRDNKYLLIGPGRWGTTDRWLGIPVKWGNITNVGTIIETVSEKLNADPSQGSHFFHNITSLGINYLGVPMKDNNFIDWAWLNGLPAETETHFLRYVRLLEPVILKIDGKASSAVILKHNKQE
ncbi:MAG: phosphoenolpyruvate synthase PpsA [Desulfamplus sp.]|nr:phosphoenolpyruvate synthase PpsA [Desulfamplus sp.]